MSKYRDHNATAAPIGVGGVRFGRGASANG